MRLVEENIRIPKHLMPHQRARAARSGPPTTAEIEEAYKQVAVIIRDHGEVYLPIFERLHMELESRKASATLLNLAMETAENAASIS